MWTLLIYVTLGVIADIFIARYYMALSARRALSASLYAIVIPPVHLRGDREGLNDARFDVHHWFRRRKWHRYILGGQAGIA
jgi:hypothetical protein